MKSKFWSICSGALVALIGMLIVITSSSAAWPKVQYSFACVLLGMAVCYLGDRI